MAAVVTLVVTAAACGGSARDAATGEAPAGAGVRPVTVTLEPLGGADVAGSVAFIPDAEDDQTAVVVELSGTDAGENPVQIHEGTCEQLAGPPVFVLRRPSDDETTRTAIDISLRDLVDGQYVVDVRRPAPDSETRVACAPIERANI